jgi:hypothetical protein
VTAADLAAGRYGTGSSGRRGILPATIAMGEFVGLLPLDRSVKRNPVSTAVPVRSVRLVFAAAMRWLLAGEHWSKRASHLTRAISDRAEGRKGDRR